MASIVGLTILSTLASPSSGGLSDREESQEQLRENGYVGCHRAAFLCEREPADPTEGSAEEEE